MTNEEIFNLTGILLQINAGLMGIAFTLLGLVPALLGVVEQRHSEFVDKELSRSLMRRGIVLLQTAVWFFLAGCVVAYPAFFTKQIWLVYASSGFVAGGMAIIGIASVQLARISRFIAFGGNL